MKTLFYMILAVVFLTARLIAPDAFRPADSQTIMSELNLSNASAREIEKLFLETPTETGAGSVSIQPVENYPAPQITETAVPEPEDTDIQKMLESPKVTDNFENGSSGFGINAGLNDDDAIRIIALNNKLSLEPKKTNGWLTWRLRPPVFKNGAAEMEFSITTCARGDRTGLLLHASDYTGGHGYYFSLACEGTVSILMDSVILGTADARNVFKNSSGEPNVMTAMIIGDSLSLLLNGQQVLTVKDSTYTEGFSGFFTAPQNNGTLTMDIQSFKIYYNE